MEELIEQITAQAGKAKMPVLLWSGGRDSTLLLHLLKTVIGSFSIIQFRQDFRKAQKAWIDQQIIEFDLKVISCAPADKFETLSMTILIVFWRFRKTEQRLCRFLTM